MPRIAAPHGGNSLDGGLALGKDAGVDSKRIGGRWRHSPPKQKAPLLVTLRARMVATAASAALPSLPRRVKAITHANARPRSFCFDTVEVLFASKKQLLTG